VYGAPHPETDAAGHALLRKIPGRQRNASINNNISKSPNITHMKYFISFALILTGVFLAGCTSTPPPVVTSAPTTVPATTVVATATPRPSFALVDSYLDEPGGYTFNSEKDIVIKNFRVDSQSWGIDYKIKPLNDDLQYCWFAMNVTNMDNGQTETFGYGRQYSIELEQMVPMYKEGFYNITMTGQGVKVWVKAAKRIP
jgi:hypothetical protein